MWGIKDCEGNWHGGNSLEFSHERSGFGVGLRLESEEWSLAMYGLEDVWVRFLSGWVVILLGE